MRKGVLLFFISLGLLSTSCLDTNESTIGGTNQFAVVHRSSVGTKYIVSSMMIQSDVLDKYDVGDALMIASYKVNTSNVTNEGIARAEYLDVEKSYLNRDQKTVTYQVADTAINLNQQIGLRDLAVLVSDRDGSAYLNRALMRYNASIADGEVYDLVFYYDETKQVSQANQPLEGRVVVDVVVNIRGEGIGESKIEENRFVLDASSLYTRLTPTEFSTNYESISVDFRYSKYNTTTNKYEQFYATNVLEFIYYAPR